LFDLYKSVLTSTTGRFIFKGVTPGKYKVFVWDEIERNSWFDPEVLRRYERFGTPVTAPESADLTIDVKVIGGSSK
jgi:hypothetical protein